MTKNTKYWIKLTLLCFSFCIIGANASNAQRLSQWLEAGDTAYFQKDYYSAYNYFTAALEYDSTLAHAWYYRGRSAYAFNSYAPALESFDKLLEYDSTKTFIDATFWIAQVYQKTGKYKQAVDYYTDFMNNPGKSPKEMVLEARKNRDDSRWASEVELRSDGMPQPQNMGDTINSPDSDFGGLFLGDQFYFSSFRFTFEKDDRRPRRSMIQLMQFTQGVRQAQLILEPFNENDEKHTAYLSMSPDQNTAYYCQCEYISSADIRCDIFFRQKNDAGLWGPAQALSVNMPGYNSSSPAFAKDPVTGENLLYFSSDRPGGQGGMDLWYGLVEENGDVKEATNLKELNTSKDERAPFYHELSRQFFFSSDGHRTLGGLDVFMSYKNANGWSNPQNIGAGTNSSYNESYYTVNENATRAVFSSDRPGSIFLDRQEEVCCYDLYEVELDKKLELEVLTFNALDSTPLLGTEVFLDQLEVDGLNVKGDLTFDQIENRRDRILRTEDQLSDTTHQYFFTLEPYQLYSVLGEKPLYYPDSQMVNLFNIAPDVEKIRRELYLRPEIVNLTVLTFDAQDSTALNGCTVDIKEIYTAMADSTDFMNEFNENGNSFRRQISPIRDYYMIATKLGYESSDFGLETQVAIEQFGNNITVRLYLQRADFSDLLPITAYFDNAIPYDRNYSDTTIHQFDVLCREYGIKEQEFFDQFSQLISEDKQFDARLYYQTFFEREVLGGLDRLEEFTDELIDYLKSDRTLEIEVQGYASPLANSRYNNQLGKRRVTSLENFFSNYKGGVLKPYIKDGLLKIKTVSYGESEAGKKAPPATLREFLADLEDSDSLDLANSRDRRLTVYSLFACIERRVEIVQVTAGVRKDIQLSDNSKRSSFTTSSN